MTRRKRSPEENERRAKIRELLLSSNISSMDDIQDPMLSRPAYQRNTVQRPSALGNVVAAGYVFA